MSFARAAPPAYCGGIGQSSSPLLLLLLLLSGVTRFSAPGDRSGGSAPSTFWEGAVGEAWRTRPKNKMLYIKVTND